MTEIFDMGKTPEIISCLIDLSPIERTLGRVDKMHMKFSMSLPTFTDMGKHLRFQISEGKLIN